MKIIQITLFRKWIQKRRSRSANSLLTALLLLLIFSSYLYLSTNIVVTQVRNYQSNSVKPLATFPVGVNPHKKTITENPNVDAYFKKHIASKSTNTSSATSMLRRVFARLTTVDWYQSVASPTGRVLVIQSGERKEQVAENFGKILNWDRADRQEFLKQVVDFYPSISDGIFAPGTYVTTLNAGSTEVADLVISRFNNEVASRYSNSLEKQVPLKDALTIASLIEREASEFEDMRLISGIIWNRLFTDINLQIDATLQYAKGTNVNEPWWPKVRPSDKSIVSPFNTYKNEGLPPAPISSASLDAILAALNPRDTDCIFYFHDDDGEFHCTATYNEHVALLIQFYGQGR
jgi:UPF0755 protein